jgi:hypothetical protein
MASLSSCVWGKGRLPSTHVAGPSATSPAEFSLHGRRARVARSLAAIDSEYAKRLRSRYECVSSVALHEAADACRTASILRVCCTRRSSARHSGRMILCYTQNDVVKV